MGLDFQRIHLVLFGLLATAFLALTFQIELMWFLTIVSLFWSYIFFSLVFCLIVLILWAKRRQKPYLLAFASLVLALLSASFIWPAMADFTQNLAPKSRLSPPIKVISYNWLGDQRPRTEVYGWFATEKPDILIIQEFNHEASAATQLYPQFPYRTKGDSDILILSKFPLTEEVTYRFNHHAMVKVIASVDGQAITLYGVHPATLRNIAELAERNAYLGTMTHYIDPKSGPILMMGDFNTTRWDPWFRRLVHQAGLHEQPRLFPLPTRMGVRSGLPFIGAPIDHILVGRHQSIDGCHTGPALGSDHLPIICSIALDLRVQRARH